MTGPILPRSLCRSERPSSAINGGASRTFTPCWRRAAIGCRSAAPTSRSPPPPARSRPGPAPRRIRSRGGTASRRGCAGGSECMSRRCSRRSASPRSSTIRRTTGCGRRRSDRLMATLSTLADAREQFLAMVGDVRPELHRYCARLTGSVIEGEDIVQETLARAFYALSLSEEVPPLRPWLFRIAHNAAMDVLKSHANKYTDATAEIEELAGFDDRPDPAVVRAALACFLSLPVAQRSAVILKDVLGHSLDETA